ncbi:helix-turn-helix domain-containing protein [Nonomuraea typhae]|uniref:helix-turn-helix domain-containing protein n=1 Tax=Nonomuraea typhae TaxID=2603600 RepID=UPI001FE6ABA1|nr:helix-turn-helix domain-containing protein [Nonomuraea typhae]
MRELAGRLSSLDPDTRAAIHVIASFDRLVEERAGLEAIVRGAAVLAGCPVRLVDPERHVDVRVLPDGRRTRDDGRPEGAPDGGDDTGLPGENGRRGSAGGRRGGGEGAYGTGGIGHAPDPGWPVTGLPGGSARIWLERPGPAGPVHAMVLERAAMAARDVLDRTRGRAPARDDPALVEVILDPTAPEQARLRAARALGIDVAGRARAVALAGGDARIIPAEIGIPGALTSVSGTLGAFDAALSDTPTTPTARVRATQPPLPPGGTGNHAVRRTGIGPAVPVRDLPDSWQSAQVALRLAADGTEQDPGPGVVVHDTLGGLAALAAAVQPGSEPIPDVHALEHAAAAAPWMLATLHAIAYSPSLRAAALAVTVHHSTLQDRLAQAEHLLGWAVREPEGRLRLQLALTLRRLHRHPVNG